ncbi:sensor histidine kinase [Azospirillum agricola]|uniref:sensor histidine kinase n=1 Tax=Azospirillum agricola TaxID=1720247 RepID=UPI000A1CB454|nr:ATP-binding protein [Azospirillum agricola]
MSAFGVVLILGLNAMIGYDLLREHGTLVDQARDETQSLALVLERHATDSFSGVAKTLAGVAEVLAVRGDRWTRGAPEVHALLRRQLALSPLTRALLVVSADGRLIHDTDTLEPADLDLSDRDYLLAHRDGLAGTVHLGVPVEGRTSGAWFVSMSRRLETPDGRFAGVAVAVVEPAAFRGFYESLKLRNDAVVTLHHADGPVVARFPDHERFVGRPVRGGAGARDEGTDRISSHRTSSEVPLVVTVSLARDAVLAPWRLRAVVELAAALGASLMLGLLTLTLVREAGRRERMLEDLQASEGALRDSQRRLILDIAARHRAEAELIAAKQASDSSNRAKTQFLANMSHELRTPLNAVIGFAEALESGIFGAMSAKQTEYVSDIRRSGLHLLSLINDILDTTKIESGKYVLHEERLAVRAVVGQCLRQIEPLAVQKGIGLAASMEPELPDLLADERALRQILLNLLSNAVKFTPAGGHIVVTADRAELDLRLRVTDTGIGIPQSELEQVLEPFHQVDNSHTRRYAGTGLGLGLVKSLVEMHQGSLGLTSALGRGTTATVVLPAGRFVVAQEAETVQVSGALA